MPLDDKLIKHIRSDFPAKAVQAKKVITNAKGDTTKIFTGYVPQYIIERLNDCFGHEGWDFNIITLQMNDRVAWCHGKLTMYVSGADEISGLMKRAVVCVKEQIGSCEYSERISYGDALKGAATNCLEKCASMLDIGHTAYKGELEATPDALIKMGDSGGEAPHKADDREALTLELKVVCKECGIGKEAFPKLVKNALKTEKETKELTVDDLKKLIAHVKTNKSPF